MRNTLQLAWRQPHIPFGASVRAGCGGSSPRRQLPPGGADLATAASTIAAARPPHHRVMRGRRVAGLCLTSARLSPPPPPPSSSVLAHRRRHAVAAAVGEGSGNGGGGGMWPVGGILGGRNHRTRRLRRRQLVCHPPARVYAVISDVGAYPQFLPWCSEATVAIGDSSVCGGNSGGGGNGHLVPAGMESPPSGDGTWARRLDCTVDFNFGRFAGIPREQLGGILSERIEHQVRACEPSPGQVGFTVRLRRRALGLTQRTAPFLPLSVRGRCGSTRHRARCELSRAPLARSSANSSSTISVT